MAASLLTARIKPLVRLVDALDRRLTPAGRLVLVMTAFAAGFGVDTTLSLGYQVFSLGLAAFVIAALGTWRKPPRISAQRTTGPLATVGEPFSYEIELVNRGERTLNGLALRDELSLSPGRPVSGSDVASWVRRFARLTRRRLAEERRWRRGGSIRETPVPEIGPGARVRVTLTFVPGRRGKVRFRAVSLFRAEPLGLARSALTLALPDRLTVLPERHVVPRLALPGARRLQQGGVANAGKVGDSEEFLGLREYRPGDSMKRIHWASWARLGRPIVRENEDEWFVRHGLVLDTFCDVDDARLLDAAASVAASLAVTLDTTESLLDLVLVEDRAYHLTAGRGVGDVASLLEVIADAQPAPLARIGALSAAARDLAPVSSGLVLVLLAWDAPRIALVDEVVRAGAECLVLLVVPPGHGAPDTSSLRAPTRVHAIRSDRVGEDLAKL